VRLGVYAEIGVSPQSAAAVATGATAGERPGDCTGGGLLWHHGAALQSEMGARM
jgi:hypothetical protein